MNILSSNDWKKEEIQKLFDFTDKLDSLDTSIFNDKILVNAFFESSTRTSLSFECAMKRLGGNVITFNSTSSSLNKGESFEDTISTLSLYGDIMVIRHPEKDKLKDATNISKIPIINGGDGNGEHPSQALLDLYSIYKKFGKNFKTKTILFIGDIKNSRTIHSLINLLNLYPSMKIHFLPFNNDLYPHDEMLNKISKIHTQNKNDIIITELDNNYSNYDIVYCTRLQKERSNNKMTAVDDKFIINNEKANKFKEDIIIMHPLPRNNELSTDVDNNHRCYYFKQMEYGIQLRMGLFYYIMNNNEKKSFLKDLSATFLLDIFAVIVFYFYIIPLLILYLDLYV